ncbi:MAG: TIGR03086 family metal-binding protein [Actinomycetes bacterium]
MVEPPADPLVTALDAHAALLAGVRDEQWTGSTPCPDWNVRTLVNHVVSGNRMFAAILRGDPLPPPDELARLRARDILGTDPLAAFRSTGAELYTAFGSPGVLDRVVQAPVGPLPGRAVLHLRITELLVHGWDLAHATGQPVVLPEDLAEEDIVFTRGLFAAGVPRQGRFGAAAQVPAGVAAIDRLAAELGRTVPVD